MAGDEEFEADLAELQEVIELVRGILDDVIILELERTFSDAFHNN